MSNRVFVYGSLKRGNKLRGMDSFGGDDAVFIGEAETISSDYELYDLGAFPAAYIGGSEKIAGEVWDVTDRLFDLLDQIESYPSFYDRTKVETSQGLAWMYYMPNITEYNSNKINSTSGVVEWSN